MQPVGMRLGTSAAANCDQQTGDLLRLAFGYGTTENNGNVLTQEIFRDSVSFSSAQTYDYDGLNRLRSITEGQGAQTFVYDRYGNRAVLDSSYIPIAAQTPVVSSDTEAAVTAIFPSNRWSGGTHDNAGNQTARYGGSFAYDAENRVTSSTVGSVTTTYAYDGEGRRVKKDAVVMVYDAFGKLAAEYGGTPTGAGRQYLTADHLGSTRLVTNSTGGDMKCSDYMPFGEEIPQGINDRGTCYTAFTDPRQKFTGKERDAETGLDYFGARYMSGAQGRFTSPDAPFTDQTIADPQSWNLYSYVRNRPLNHVDPNGEAAWFVGALVGAGMDIAVQTWVDGKSIEDVDYGSVAISAAAGAVGGGLATKLEKLAPWAKFAIEGAVDVSGSVAQQLHKDGNFSLAETLIDVSTGRVAGEVAGRLAKGAAQQSSEVKQILKEADRKTRIAANAADAGNPSSARRRAAQAADLDKEVRNRVARRSTAASTSASQGTSSVAKKVYADAKKQEEERRRQSGGN